MPRYAKYDSSGTIIATLDVPEHMIEMNCREGEFYLECDAEPHDSIDVETKTVIKGKAVSIHDIPTKPVLKPYQELRTMLYPNVGEQMDMLFRDVKAGAFGDTAKNSEWFKRIELVKTLAPKEGAIDPSMGYLLGDTPVISVESDPDYMNELEYLNKKKNT